MWRKSRYERTKGTGDINAPSHLLLVITDISCSCSANKEAMKVSREPPTLTKEGERTTKQPQNVTTFILVLFPLFKRRSGSPRRAERGCSYLRLTLSWFAVFQGPVIYAQLDHSGSKNSFHKNEPVVYADIRKNWRQPLDQNQAHQISLSAVFPGNIGEMVPFSPFFLFFFFSYFALWKHT